jgi:hypothetical protein
MERPFTRRLVFVSSLLLTAIVAATAVAQEQEKKTLAIFDITPTDAVAQRAQKDGKGNELAQIIQSLDPQLIDRMHNTRKFTIMAHSDLAAIIGGAAFNTDALKKMPNMDYGLVAKLDSFQDSVGVAENNIAWRNVQFSIHAEIYKTSSGTVLETANFQGRCNLPTISATTVGSEATDKALNDATRKMANEIANRVAYVLYPAKVIDVTGKQVTVDWGDGLFITKGETWDVFKKKTNGAEIPVGAIRVTRVLPENSTAEIVGEDLGIAEGCIARKAEDIAQKAR